MENIRDFFNEIAPEWNNNDNNYGLIDELLAKIKIKDESNVLDLGCGKGVITPRLYNYSKNRVDAIDLSINMINDAKIINDDINKYNFICGDFFNYDFENKYDYIVIFNAYPHFLEPSELSKRAYSLLNNNGKLIILHDISKRELNTHHKQYALRVSRPLNKPEEEYESFKNEFNLLGNIDNDNSYFMMLEKR